MNPDVIRAYNSQYSIIKNKMRENGESHELFLLIYFEFQFLFIRNSASSRLRTNRLRSTHFAVASP